MIGFVPRSPQLPGSGLECILSLFRLKHVIKEIDCILDAVSELPDKQRELLSNRLQLMLDLPPSNGNSQVQVLIPSRGFCDSDELLSPAVRVRPAVGVLASVAMVAQAVAYIVKGPSINTQKGGQLCDAAIVSWPLLLSRMSLREEYVVSRLISK